MHDFAARLGRPIAVTVAALSAVVLVPAAHAQASGAGGPANCQVSMASPRTSAHTVSAVVQVTCASPVDVGIMGALWRARGNAAQKMAASSQVFRHTTTARMTVTSACPGGTSSWMSTGNSSYTVNGVSYLMGGISPRQRLTC